MTPHALKIRLFVLFFVFTSTMPLSATSPASHQINLSLVLTGHILLGIGYSYHLDDQQGVQATVFVAPEKGLPFALNTGYFYIKGDGKWRLKLGGEMTLLVSPCLPEGPRKTLPMFNFVPGVQYTIDDNSAITPQLWLSFLPTANVKVAPTALEVRYRKAF